MKGQTHMYTWLLLITLCIGGCHELIEQPPSTQDRDRVLLMQAAWDRRLRPAVDHCPLPNIILATDPQLLAELCGSQPGELDGCLMPPRFDVAVVHRYDRYPHEVAHSWLLCLGLDPDREHRDNQLWLVIVPAALGLTR